jgi:hypothetical protein
MGEVTTIGLDLAKHVFQVHGVDAEGATVLRKLRPSATISACRSPSARPPGFFYQIALTSGTNNP